MGYTGDQKKFGFYLSNYRDNDDGLVTFGGIAAEKFTGPITYMDVNLNPAAASKLKDTLTWWVFSVQKATISVDGISGAQNIPMVGEATEQVNDVISDTGTTLIYLPTSVAGTINEAVGAQYNRKYGIWIIDCAKNTTAPDVIFNFNGVPFNVPASMYIFEGQSATRTQAAICITAFMEGAEGDGPPGTGLSILGDSFLRNWYSIYDLSTTPPRVGFAKAVHNVVPPSKKSSGTPRAVSIGLVAGLISL
ncbi:hypothetical protein HDU91_003986, partial [Kappamyces sp. JEL0680]